MGAPPTSLLVLSAGKCDFPPSGGPRMCTQRTFGSHRWRDDTWRMESTASALAEEKGGRGASCQMVSNLAPPSIHPPTRSPRRWPPDWFSSQRRRSPPCWFPRICRLLCYTTDNFIIFQRNFRKHQRVWNLFVCMIILSRESG